MKTIFSVLLLVFVTLACNQSGRDISPSDKLYKRWKSVKIGQSGKWQAVTNPDIIEFLPDGTIRYEKRESLCCAPVKVQRKGSILTILETGHRNGAYCAQVSCVALTELYILLLTETALALDYRYGDDSIYSIHFEAIP
ncbi:hypothetical protein ACFPMF_10645 [Larkinella bovis]|uniref:Lipocalin-like domain-containing protein n=1 Tax=Larkinella bovis TaxID=683041 RepID=A0ABW0I8U2_9BACT